MVQLAAGGSWLFCLLIHATSCLSSPWPASTNAWWRSSKYSHICKASPTTRASSSHRNKDPLDLVKQPWINILPTFVSSYHPIPWTKHLILQPVLNLQKIKGLLIHFALWITETGCDQIISGILPVTHYKLDVTTAILTCCQSECSLFAKEYPWIQLLKWDRIIFNLADIYC